jgi:ribosomal protein S18 acetylase RimI-like enzyme
MHIEIILNPKLQDFEKIIGLLNNVFSKYPGHVEYTAQESYKRMSESKDPIILIAKINDEIAGFAMCYERYPKHYHLWELGVSENFRKQGIASKLYDEIENYAKTNKYDGVTLNTFNRYTDSLRLAIKRGYEIYDLEKDGEYENNPKLKLKLQF